MKIYLRIVDEFATYENPDGEPRMHARTVQLYHVQHEYQYRQHEDHQNNPLFGLHVNSENFQLDIKNEYLYKPLMNIT